MNESHDQGSIRLNKHLALQLGVSRREADNYIEKGRVRINGDTVPLGARVSPLDTVTVDGKTVGSSAELTYITLHKPAGYLSSRRSQGGVPTIYSLLPKKYHSLKTVGRLDKDSSGILLMSNDGDFTYQMTHPKFTKTKIYHVRLDYPLEPLHQQMISDYGVLLEDGSSKLGVSRLDDTPTYEVVMSEGRNRQIRRTFRALGYTVTYLHRLQFGNYALGDIPPGEHREIKIS